MFDHSTKERRLLFMTVSIVTVSFCYRFAIRNCSFAFLTAVFDTVVRFQELTHRHDIDID